MMIEICTNNLRTALSITNNYLPLLINVIAWFNLTDYMCPSFYRLLNWKRK